MVDGIAKNWRFIMELVDGNESGHCGAVVVFTNYFVRGRSRLLLHLHFEQGF